MHRFGDWLQKCAIESQNQSEENGTTVSAADYPSMKTRIDYLKDDI